ncbi:DUF6443 domain-containing protein [Flavobacterium lindanitolerans]|uniref:RHS repeat-associated protein n=1 Tax=Flavobacterium lindanitolerans TaxID=428988 RepID=A0A497U6E0_9FLAO|nr:DUF6443 domain-containing protein [Flavobacterium lindanitolerans]PKW20465.1 RHS repeat-associated protein [Flavobacterium lindanitolerans]RLJ23908.1 RHS repeat-associated protein [Flavobacterium lindanitolerans]
MKNIYKIFLLIPYILSAQSHDQNYVKAKTYKVESSVSLPDNDPEQVKVDITYYDGLGRPIQKIAHKQSGSGKDLGIHMTYDILGREDRQYLPYEKGSQDMLFDVDAEVNTLNYPLYTGNSNPYTKIFFDKSPLDRVLKQAAPGAPWAGNENNDNDRTLKYVYDVNSTDDKVQDFYVDAGILASRGYCPAGKLYKTITKDENWTSGKRNTAEEFKDGLDRVLLKRTYKSETSILDTYYVYNTSGDLAFVIPPAASETVATTSSSQLPYSYYQRVGLGNILLSYNGGGDGGISINNNSITVSFAGSFSATQIDVSKSITINASQPIPDMTIGTLIAGFARYTVYVQNNQLKFIDNYPNAGNFTTLNHSVSAPLDTSAFGSGETVYTTVINQNIVSDLCYQYKYDAKFRLVEKKVPGRQWEYIVYDKLDRAIAMGPTASPFSDLSSVGWHITKFDAFDRQILTGWMPIGTEINSTTRQNLQMQLNAETTYFNESRSASDSNINGIPVRYTNQAFPTSGYHILSINYYDDYSYGGFPIDFGSVEGQEVYFNLVRKPNGLTTGTWSRALQSSSNYTGELLYILYDYKEREIRKYITNYLGGYTKTDSRFDFSGKPIHTLTAHSRLGAKGEIKIYDKYKYTAQGRLLLHTHEILGQNPEQLLSLNAYDELGQLISKKVGGTDLDGNWPLQKIDFSYNIRGWLTEINSINNFEDEIIANKDLFAFKLNYWEVGDSPDSNLPPLFNGNISQSSWISRSDYKKRDYAYYYDPLNRLRSAFYFKNGRASNSYNEFMDYDKNGNIMHINRFGDLDYDSFSIEIDALDYAYDTHGRLKSVKDNTNHPAGFRDGADMEEEYLYDNRGNIIKDENKGILSISYNHMDLPLEINFRAGGKINYLYNASGEKLKKTVTEGTVVTETEYLSGFQYSSGILDFFQTTEGYVQAIKTRFAYVFNYTDHLGNVRLSYGMDDKEGKLVILEENHYYPFGAKHEKYNSDRYEYVLNEFGVQYPLGISPLPPGYRKAYQFKYNEKEFQDEIGLNLYDYGARNYDPAIGRWTTIDPLAEISDDETPFQYAHNNPIAYLDPTGLTGQTWATKYIDTKGNLILETDDGSEDIITVPDSELKKFKSLVRYTAPVLYNSQEWNDHFKSEFLGIETVNKLHSLLDAFTTQWSRQNAIDYLQNPTMKNALAMSYSEALSQWTDPQRVLGAAGVLAFRPRINAEGVVYLRTDLTGKIKPYVGQAKNEARYLARQAEHARAHPNADFEFKIIDRGNTKGNFPTSLDVKEQKALEKLGGPTNKSNPTGGASNKKNVIKQKN